MGRRPLRPGTIRAMHNPMAFERTLILRAEKASAQANWFLPRIGRDAAGTATLTRPIKGDFLSAYEDRRPNHRVPELESDPIIPWRTEARISRYVGFKMIKGGATVIYWRHAPVARFVANDEQPHIYITGHHLGGTVAAQRKGVSAIRAYKALNPLLDYLLAGVRLETDGVHEWRRGGDRVTPWPNTAFKPGVYFPVYGRRASVPFWTSRHVELVSNRPVCRYGGEEWDTPPPFPAAINLDGLI